MTANTPMGEDKRLQALRRMRLLDTPADAAYDRFTALAARVFQTPVAIISLVDANRTWFKSCHGLPVQEMPRDLSFCARAILDDGVLVVPDMSCDLRFSDNPLVTGEPWIRFYAAAPLVVEDGQRIGAFAVMDRRPHADFGSAQCANLRDFAALVSRQIEETARHAPRETRAAAVKRESLLAVAAESLNDALLVFDAEDRIVDANRSAEQMLNLERSEIIGRPYSELLLPARYRAQHLEAMRSHIATGRSSYFGRRIEQPVLRPNGQEFTVESCATPHGLGKRTTFTVCLRDISEQSREAEEQQKFISLVENSYDFVSMADFDGRILYLNRSGRRLVGAPDGELNEYHSIEILPPEQRRFYGATVLPAILATGRWQGEMQFQHANGGLIDVHATMFHVTNRNTGAPLCIATTARDITLQKRADIELRRAKEAAEEAASAKSMFLANMSHEIRTPMNAVIGMTSLLLETSLNAEQREFAEVIRNSGEALLSLIGRVLDFSKIDSGKLEMETTPFSLHECVAEVLDLLGPQACDKGLELVFVPDASAPVCLIGDVGRLRQILVNLTANAIKFTDKGEVSIRVRYTQQPADLDEDECELQFTVRDTGIGIGSDRLEKIFEAFTQSDASHARRFGGAGLGLTISRRLAELMGGRMWVGSKIGEGSSFHFTVRLKRDQATSSLAEPHAVLRDKRLLLVTASPSLRDSFEQLSRLWGFRLSCSPQTPEPSAAEGDLLVVDLPAAFDAERQSAIIERLSGCSQPILLLRPVAQRASLELLIPGEKLASWRAVNKPVKPASLQEAILACFGVAPQHEVKSQHEFSDDAMAEHMPFRILLAEDNIVNQKMAELMLGKYGYRIDCVEDGEEALEALRRQGYDVIFMDMQMPRMDGVAAARVIRSSLPKAAQPWIIAMTANASLDARNECMAAGMNDFVTKPVRPQDLKNALLRAPLRNATPAARRKPTTFVASAAIHQMYVKSARKVLVELQQHAASANAEGLRNRAHFLRGSSLVLGANEVARLCAELENAALEPEQIRLRLQQLSCAIEDASALLLPSPAPSRR